MIHDNRASENNGSFSSNFGENMIFFSFKTAISNSLKFEALFRLMSPHNTKLTVLMISYLKSRCLIKSQITNNSENKTHFYMSPLLYIFCQLFIPNSTCGALKN